MESPRPSYYNLRGTCLPSGVSFFRNGSELRNLKPDRQAQLASLQKYSCLEFIPPNKLFFFLTAIQLFIKKTFKSWESSVLFFLRFHWLIFIKTGNQVHSNLTFNFLVTMVTPFENVPVSGRILVSPPLSV